MQARTDTARELGLRELFRGEHLKEHVAKGEHVARDRIWDGRSEGEAGLCELAHLRVGRAADQPKLHLGNQDGPTEVRRRRAWHRQFAQQQVGGMHVHRGQAGGLEETKSLEELASEEGHLGRRQRLRAVRTPLERCAHRSCRRGSAE